VSGWLSRAQLSARAEYIEDRTGYRVVLEGFAESPACDQWGLQIGDSVHNLRSSLDNLCFALARLRRDPPERPRLVQFPIFHDADEFRRDRRVAATLEQLPPEAATRVELWQPYRRVSEEVIKRDALNLLGHLSNQDKHRLPQVVLMAVNQRNHTVALKFASEDDASAFVPPQITVFPPPVVSGSTLMEVRGRRPVAIATIGGRIEIEAVTAIQTLVGLEDAVQTLAALCSHTKQILEDFRERFFT
jgi:hypothetical protein